MPTPLKVLLYCVSFVLLIIVALVIFIQTQVTPERLRTYLLPAAESALQRKVTFGDVEIGFFSGVSVSDLTVLKKASEAPVLTVKRLKLNYRLWSLLKGMIDIDQVILEQPEIELVRMPDGQLNLTDLFKGAKEHEGNSTRTKKRLSVTDVPFRIQIMEVKVVDGAVTFVDQFRNARTPYRYQFEHLNLDARDITFNDSFPINLSASFAGQQIDLSGNYHLRLSQGDLLLHLHQLDLVRFAPYFRDSLPVKLGSRRASAQVEIDIHPDQFASKGRIDVQELDLSLQDQPDLKLKDSNLVVDFALNYQRGEQVLTLSTLLVDLNRLRFGGDGNIDFKESSPVVDFKVTLDQLDLRQLMQVAPGQVTRLVKKYSPAGSLSGYLHLGGALDSGICLIGDSRFSLKDVQVSSNNIRAGINGDLSVNDGVLVADGLLLNYGETEARVDIRAEELFSSPVKADFLLTSDLVDLNSLGPVADIQVQDPESDEVNRQPAEEGDPEMSEIGPFSFDSELKGRIEIRRLIYRDLISQNAVADVVLRDNVLFLNNVQAQIDEGRFQGNGLVDLGVRGLVYRGVMSLEQPDVQTLASGLFAEKSGSVKGSLSLQSRISGRGMDSRNLLKNLTLEGAFSVNQGELRETGISQAIAALLKASDFKVLSFRSFSGEYILQNGLISLTGDLDSSKVALKPTGTVTTGGVVDLDLEMRIAPDRVKGLDLNRAVEQIVTDSQGRGYLPLKVSGHYERPSVSIDTESLTEQALKRSREKVTEKMLDKLPGEEQAKEPLRQLLDNTLEKLFQ